MTHLRTAVVLLLGIGSTGCFDMFKNIFDSPTSPSTAEDGVRSYLGTWNGATAAPAPQSCGGLQWKITSQTGNQASGEFGATCAGEVALAGTVTATHGDTTIPWAATGTATRAGATCPFTMTGTGTF